MRLYYNYWLFCWALWLDHYDGGYFYFTLFITSCFLTELNIINNKLLCFFIGVCGRCFQ